MPEPFCKIDWPYEGYRQVWLYKGNDLQQEPLHVFCRDLAAAMSEAETLTGLTATIERIAAAHELTVRVYPGPSHVDPLGDTVRVGVFREAPVEWSI